jgi:hypothetical protein
LLAAQALTVLITPRSFFASPEFRDCFPSKAIISPAVTLLIPLTQLRHDIIAKSI